ncbi:MAG TPA: ABC transporter substrate-binding protein, partial [Gammaproteobacteria bacterium]|nr:ABC transporter substrate-binding protein [Gammaproteobacteria bacterium]
MKYVGISVLVIGAIFLALIMIPDVDRDARPVRIGFLNIAASLPLFIAEENGFFSAEGVDVETYAIASSNQLVDGVLAENLDMFVEASAVPVFAATLQLEG